MVNYLPSQATTSITVTALDVATSLTISAPASVVQGQSFNISGILVRNDTGFPIPNEEISINYNGSPIGTGTTGVDGDYLITGSIPSVGIFTLTANFAGAERPGLTLLPSMAQALTRIPGFQPLSPYLGIIAIGLAMIGASVYSSRR